jgi:hypothetical protein
MVFSNAALATPHQGLKGAVTIVARRARRARPVQTGLCEARAWREVKGAPGEFVRSGEFLASYPLLSFFLSFFVSFFFE